MSATEGIAIALRLLREHRQAHIDTHSLQERGEDGEYRARPGTLEPEAEPALRDYDAAIAALESLMDEPKGGEG